MRTGKYLLIFILFPFLALGQDGELSYRLKYTDVPLSEILVDLRDRYSLNFSFDHGELSKFRIDLEASFGSPEQILEKLLDGLPLAYEKSGAIFLIYHQDLPAREVVLRLYLLDAVDGEAMPFSNVIIDGKVMASDIHGRITTRAMTDPVSTTISHIGYYRLDTLLPSGEHTLRIFPSVVNLKEVVIEGRSADPFTLTGSEAGISNLNTKTANQLPGNGDNAIFNLLRLQPGVLGSSEQANDLIIWGSAPGQSKIIYDGFTVFGLKNFDKNLSVINPFSIKEIQLLKGGYPSRYEGRTGGIVSITGTEGRKDKPDLQLNVNTATVNGLISFPLFKSTAISATYRNAYRNLFRDSELTVASGANGVSKGKSKNSDFTLSPEYNYNDLNLKWAGKVRGDPFYLSYFLAKDQFAYGLNDELRNNTISLSSSETNRQEGMGAYYSKSWKSGDRSYLKAASSSLEKAGRLDRGLVRGANDFRRTTQAVNSVGESRIEFMHEGLLGQHHLWNAGLQLIGNDTGLLLDSSGVELQNITGDQFRLGYFLEDEIFRNKWKFRLGGRLDQVPGQKEVHIQPRASLSYGISENHRLSLSAGMYDQFISQYAVIDEDGNISYAWITGDADPFPVNRGQHLVLGIAGEDLGFAWNMELFRKKTEGTGRFLLKGQELQFHSGFSQSAGLDLFLGREIGPHYLWASYSLSKTQEWFTYFQTNDMQRALNDQLHELKLASIIKFDPVFFSATYVYGSGFPDPLNSGTSSSNSSVYSRLDLASSVLINRERPYLEAGISVLNVFNRENIGYENYLRLPESEFESINVHAESVPFTPTVFVKITL